jgi:hypothetical protein
MDLPGHVKTMAPGMSQVIEAGEAYTLTDDNGKELELVGRIDPLTLAFVRAFDVWYGVKGRVAEDTDVYKAAWMGVITAFNNLPKHVVKELIGR